MRNNKKLTVIDGETLMNMRIKPISFCIDSLLPQGVSLLCGAPKIGKSWLVLDWCVRIAKGEEVWNFKTAKGTTLYLCLEDNLSRIQQRLNEITDEVPNNVFFATSSCSMSDGLAEQIEMFIAEQNGSDIGTLFGLTAGLIASAISKEENIKCEESGLNMSL